MNHRMRDLRKKMGKSQEDFGKLLGLSKSGVSEIESGRRNVTEQHIIMLRNCKDFNINENWLRTGVGEMFMAMDRETELAKLTVNLFKESSDSFKNRFISLLAKMSDDEWDMLEGMVEKLAKKE